MPPDTLQVEKADIIAAIIKDAQDAIELATGERVILSERLPFFSKKKVEIERIMKVVAEYYGCDSSFRVGQIKTPHISIPRMIASYLAYLIYGCGTLKEIANFYGIKNHSSVYNHIQKVTGYLEIYPSYRTDLENIRWTLEGN